LTYLQQGEWEGWFMGMGSLAFMATEMGKERWIMDEALEKALDGEGSDDARGVEGGQGEDSHSSLDLHTPSL
jgi:hypothetical protein